MLSYDRAVVDPETGKAGASLSVDAEGGQLRVYDNHCRLMATINGGEHGGHVGVYASDSKSGVSLGIGEHGGVLWVEGKNGKGKVTLNTSENGGAVFVSRGERHSARVQGGNSCWNPSSPGPYSAPFRQRRDPVLHSP